MGGDCFIAFQQLSSMNALVEDLPDFRHVNVVEYDDIECFDILNNFHFNYNNYFTVFHANMRSFNENLDKIAIILNSFKIKFKVIVSTETWLDLVA